MIRSISPRTRARRSRSSRSSRIRSRSTSWLPILMLAAFAIVGVFNARVSLADSKPLPTNPDFTIGKLDNGMTYMVREHSTPPNWVAIRLLVESGSLNEEEDQRGLAHFFEHLAFNGSKHFPPGELIPAFENLGVEFGRNLNASTGFDRTLYLVNLPKNDEQTLRTGLLWASDVAFNIGLTPDEIDKERGVIVEEWRTGLGPQERIQKATWSALMPGARLPDRWPIGVIDVIQAANRERLQRYYDTWYRPNKMTIMVVGDVKTDEVVPMIRELFDLPARDGGKNEPDRAAGITPYEDQKFAVITDPEFVGCDVDLVYLAKPTAPATTVETMRRQQVLSLAAWIFNRRLDNMIAEGGMPFRSAQVAVAPVFGQFTYSTAGVTCDPDQWQPSLEIVTTEVKRMCDHGAVESELERAGKSVLAQARAFAAQEATLPSQVLASIAISQVNAGDTLISAKQNADLLEQILPTITVDEVNDVYRQYFDPSHMAFTVTLPETEGVDIPSDDRVREVADETLNKGVEAYTEEAMASALMDKLPAPGEIAEQSHDAGLDVTTATFANNAVMHYKFNNFRENSVTVTINIEGGEIQETADTRGLTDAAVAAWNQSATSKLSSSQIQDLLSDKNIGVTVSGGNRDSVQISVSGLPEDLEPGLQLAYLLMTDPIVEPSAFTNWRDDMLEEIEGRKFDAIANVRRELALARTEDPRYDLVSREDVERITRDDVAKWMRGIINDNPIEVTVVGDVKLDDVMPMIARYVGSLPNRQTVGTLAGPLRDIRIKPGPQNRTGSFISQDPVAVAFISFRGPNADEVRNKRMMEVAASIMSTRMTKEIRENRGIVYSIGAVVAPADVYPDMGLFYAASQCAPENADTLVSVALDMYTTFAKEGPTQDEVQTALAQVTSNLSRDIQEPGYWVNALSHLNMRDGSLDEFRDPVAFFEREVTPDAVREVFAEYFKPVRTITVKVLSEEE